MPSRFLTWQTGQVHIQCSRDPILLTWLGICQLSWPAIHLSNKVSMLPWWEEVQPPKASSHHSKVQCPCNNNNSNLWLHTNKIPISNLMLIKATRATVDSHNNNSTITSHKVLKKTMNYCQRSIILGLHTRRMLNKHSTNWLRARFNFITIRNWSKKNLNNSDKTV